MYEELYVTDPVTGKRSRLDLPVPSGITLNFNSNIFSDLSKITCSYSYTFSLPMTANNRRILDLADDLRHSSRMTRRKVTAEFIQNGIRLFDDAYLYIDGISDGTFQCVLTWGVIRGMETLNDDDLSLREITFEGLESDIVRWGANITAPQPADWDASADYFIPFRKTESVNLGEYILGTSTPIKLPVVPLWRVVKGINDYYGTDFYFGDAVKGSDTWDEQQSAFTGTGLPDLIAYGAVPLVNRELTDEQYEERTGTFTNIDVYEYLLGTLHTGITVWEGDNEQHLPNILTFDFVASEKNYFGTGNDGTDTTAGKTFTFYLNSLASVEEVELDGYIRVSIADIYQIYNSSGELTDSSGTDDDPPQLIVYKRTWSDEDDNQVGEITYEEAATLEGTFYGYETLNRSDGSFVWYYVYEFDFRAVSGADRITVSPIVGTSETYPCFFSIDHYVRTVQEVTDIKIVPGGNITDNAATGWEADLVTNLPDVSCLTFMKGLYYMLGAFPQADSSGRIVPLYYTDLYDAIAAGRCPDWSAKLLSQPGDLPEEVGYSVSGFARKNYYLMKNDDLDDPEPDDDEDYYEPGMGCITCADETLDATATIIQLPWYGPFLRDADRPLMETGRDMKYEEYDTNDDGSISTSFCEAEPAIGTVRAVEQCAYDTDAGSLEPIPQGTYTMMFEVWNGFKDIQSKDSPYAPLQAIMSDPVVVTEYAALDEFDLRDLDYATPVYLSKYNAYFAIVSIQRDEDGLCECEFVRLPPLDTESEE